MRTFLIVAVAVAVSGAAFAKDLKGSVMTDAEMDKVTAGVAAQPGAGLDTAASQGGHVSGVPASTTNPPGGRPGLGRCTAGRAVCD